MIIGVIAAEQLAPRSADELIVGRCFIYNNRLMHGAIAADGEAREGAGNRKNVFKSIPCGHYQDRRPLCAKLLRATLIWRDGRVVEGARLESVYRGNSIEGSNPSLSARISKLL